MSYKRCNKCKGSKSVLEIGGLHKNCKECNGIGYKEVIEEKDVDDFLDQNTKEEIINNIDNKEISVNTHKKRGRKKKVET